MKPYIERPNPFRSRKFLRSTRFPLKSQSRNSTKHSWRFLILIGPSGPQGSIHHHCHHHHRRSRRGHRDPMGRSKINMDKSLIGIGSIPCGLPADQSSPPAVSEDQKSEAIPIQYGGRTKRYGERAARSSSLYPGAVDILLRRSSLHKWYPQRHFSSTHRRCFRWGSLNLPSHNACKFRVTNPHFFSA